MAKKKRKHPATQNHGWPRNHGRTDTADAFVPEPESGRPVRDDFAEIVAEAFVESATSGEERGEDLLNEFVVEELGGPFIDDASLEDAPTDPGLPPN